MIVVIGSRHDPVAARLSASLPDAALCSAEDLSKPGWSVSPTRPGVTWVVQGEVVDDRDITGVLVRRPTIYAEELVTTHPDDRSYLAAEMHAFLIFLLATTSATVANPVGAGALGEELFRPERWMRAAKELGQVVVPIRLTDGPRQRRRLTPVAAEVVGAEVIGAVSDRMGERAVAIARRIDVKWATFVFDGRHRLLTITGNQEPSASAVSALGRLLSRSAAS